MSKATNIEENIQLGETSKGMMVLTLATIKTLSGAIVSRASVGFAQDGMMIFEPFSDYNERVLTSSPARVTAKAMEYVHRESFGEMSQRNMYVARAMAKHGHLLNVQGMRGNA